MNKQLSKLNILNNNLFDNKVTITLFFFLEKSIHNRQSLIHDDTKNYNKLLLLNYSITKWRKEKIFIIIRELFGMIKVRSGYEIRRK